jgi:hypothetical protein
MEADGMEEVRMLQSCVRALGMRQVIAHLADLAQEEADSLIHRGDRVRAYAASQSVRVLRRVLRELPTSATIGTPLVTRPGRMP